ncbi:MAG TPA: HAMP domain-containing sensor histidine kinase [Thermoanaerobaculia bacterium]|nr:HAMP domain-containing sensor histidine kinase [Thermoanaerobaculia bacterium]
MTRGALALVLALAASAAVLAGALLWIGRTTLRLEKASAEAQRRAALEEKVRLALWRMDSSLTAFIGRENARAVEAFDRELPGTPAAIAYGPLARRRFEVSPQPSTATGDGLPTAELAAALGGAGLIFQSIPQANQQNREVIAQASPQTPAPVSATPPVSAQTVVAQTSPPPSTSPAPKPEDTQAVLNKNEFLQRSQNLASQQSAFPPEPKEEPAPRLPEAPASHPVPKETPAPRAVSEIAAPRRVSVRPTPVTQVETTLQPVWVHGELYLVRRVRRGEAEKMQGIWIDWPALRGWLLGQVRDLLPAADLLPGDDPSTDPGRRIALLPVRLDPGRLPTVASPAWTPARLTLTVSSATIALVLAAVAALLIASLRQSQRRAEFVSAVTHELRTPLTTFRLYTDMLAEGMVAPAEQQDYLGTLRAEADRLGHLVENVLAYSRLERHSEPRLEPVPLADLLGELRDRLSGHALRAGMGLAVDLPFPELANEIVLVDRAAVERILLNLMDNACKYAAGGTDARLEVRPLRRGRHLVLHFQDRGPGISHVERRRIFRPFHKSAARAAGGVPGVGLGLPLSRRLARSMGGNLRLADPGPRGGAAFELSLRRATS